MGESIIEDWRDELIRHYHGLNDSELWFNQSGDVLFSYLDSADPGSQFVIRVGEGEGEGKGKGPLRAGKLARQDYIECASLERELPLIALSDRDAYARLSECRDVVTNFRPTGQMEPSRSTR